MPEAPEPNQPRERSLNSLDERLKAFEAQRAPKVSPIGGTKGISDGYRLLAGLIGGLLGGLGLGWTFDYFAHTSPIGLISGLLIGTVVSIVGVVVQASQMSAKAAANSGPVPPAPADDDEDA
jgi:ATP synthase protein I